MKKTLSITLGGRIFSIEEDGYNLLDTYLKSLRARFASDTSVDELLADIEFSFGEKFQEKMSRDKVVVTREDVEVVIAVMGEVDEIASDSEETKQESMAFPSVPQSPVKKRFYRNPDDRLIAGVCSGIATYFDIDPLVVRLIAIALIFANGLGILIYFILWICIPAAETSLQKLEMRGESPSVSKFQELTKDRPIETREGRLYRALNAPLRVIGRAFDLLTKRFIPFVISVIRVLAGGGAILFSFFFTTLATILLVVLGTNVNSRYITSDLPLTELARNPLFYVGLGSSYLLALIPLILLAIFGVSLLRRKNQFRVGITAGLIAVWILAAGGTAASASQLGPWVYTHVREVEEKTLVSRTIEIPNVDRISVAQNLQVTVRPGDTASVTLSGSEDDLTLTHVTTSQGVLTLTQTNKKRDPRICIGCLHQRTQVVVTLPHLTQVNTQDQAGVRVEDAKEDLLLQLKDQSTIYVTGIRHGSTTSTQRLTLLQEDNSFASLTGRSAYLGVTLRDNARLDADTLDATHVEIVTENNSRASVSPVETFAATSTNNSYIRSTNNEIPGTIVERQNSHIWIDGARD